MSASEKIHVVVAEAAPVVSAGLNACLRKLPGMTVIPIEVKNFDDLVRCVNGSDPDLVMVNPAFGGVFDPSRLRAATQDRSFRLVAIETAKLSPHTLALYDDSVSVVDDLPAISTKIRTLCQQPDESELDREPISQREKEIIALVAKGMTNKEIADKLFLSVHTVITHRRNIARKLEIHSATGLTIYAIVNHLVDLDDIKM